MVLFFNTPGAQQRKLIAHPVCFLPADCRQHTLLIVAGHPKETEGEFTVRTGHQAVLHLYGREGRNQCEQPVLKLGSAKHVETTLSIREDSRDCFCVEIGDDRST